MKKVLFAALLLLSSAAIVTSCNDDDNSAPVSQTPAADVAGTYIGSLNSVYIDPVTQQEVSKTVDATIELNEESKYVVGVSLESTDVNKEGVANISAMSSMYPFTNKSTGEANTFGAAFSGDVSGNVCKLTYTEETTIRAGGRPRKVTTTFTFTGRKGLE